MKRIATLGECMIELRELGPASIEPAFGGDTLNTAVYLARLGAGRGLSVDYVTALGDDPFSDRMIAAWRAEGVGTDLVARLPGRLPGLYWIHTDDQGERTFYYWRQAAAARELLRGLKPETLQARLAGHDLLYLSGISVSILDWDSRERLMALLDRLRQTGTRIAADTNHRPRNWIGPEEARDWMTRLFRRADIALPTFEDEAALFGDTAPAATIDRLMGLGVGEVVVKCGAEPCELAWPGGTASVAGETVAPVDTTAAGDSFNAGYLAGRLLGQAPEAAARMGRTLAATVVQHRGAVIPLDSMPDLL